MTLQLMEGTLKRHATKMKGKTAFDAEARRIHEINERAATVSEIYYADRMIKELKRLARNTRSARRERYLRAYHRRSKQLREQIRILESRPNLTADERDKIELWKKMLVRDDDRAYGAIRSAVANPAEIGQWMWWSKIAEHERFSLVELSSPVKSERNRLKNIFGF